jgi:hypothetical protein
MTEVGKQLKQYTKIEFLDAQGERPICYTIFSFSSQFFHTLFFFLTTFCH